MEEEVKKVSVELKRKTWKKLKIAAIDKDMTVMQFTSLLIENALNSKKFNTDIVDINI